MKTLMRLLYISLIFTVISCSDDITSINNNPQAYQAGTVPGENFFTNATRNLVDVITYGTTPANFAPGMTLKVLAQQFAEATYFDASSYNLVNVGNGLWVTLYRDVLRDYKEAKTLIEKELSDPLNTPENLITIKNKLSIIEILQVYTYSILLNTYGDIPYHGALNTSLKSEALDSDNITPAYDDAASVYDDLFARLDKALSELEGEESFGESDIIYQGDVAAWMKFGQSLKLRMALTLADVNPTLAKSAAEEAAPFVFESNDDNAVLEYLGITPNTNPIWVGIIQSQRFDYVASNTLLELMEDSSAVDDPRIPFYYTTDKAGGYSAGTYGKGNSYEIFSHPGPGITRETTPGVLLDYAEVEFYLAEAATRNYNVGGTAASHYTAGIEASIDYWGGSSSQALTFLADPAINFATAPGTDLQAIARQKYVALFNRGLEAWTEYRRLDYPKFKAPPVANGDFPIRFTYPNSEQTANGENYTAAAAAIGGDVVTNKVFWDVK
jgi:hypothetical protein